MQYVCVCVCQWIAYAELSFLRHLRNRIDRMCLDHITHWVRENVYSETLDNGHRSAKASHEEWKYGAKHWFSFAVAKQFSCSFVLQFYSCTLNSDKPKLWCKIRSIACRCGYQWSVCSCIWCGCRQPDSRTLKNEKLYLVFTFRPLVNIWEKMGNVGRVRGDSG